MNADRVTSKERDGESDTQTQTHTHIYTEANREGELDR